MNEYTHEKPQASTVTKPQSPLLYRLAAPFRTINRYPVPLGTAIYLPTTSEMFTILCLLKGGYLVEDVCGLRSAAVPSQNWIINR